MLRATFAPMLQSARLVKESDTMTVSTNGSNGARDLYDVTIIGAGP
jgi:hypothetical protein